MNITVETFIKALCVNFTNNELTRHRLKCLYMAKESQAHPYFNDRPRQPPVT